jgi:hypothetical protein
MSLKDPVNLGHRANQEFLLNSLLKEANLGLRFCNIMRSGLASPDLYVRGKRRANWRCKARKNTCGSCASRIRISTC